MQALAKTRELMKTRTSTLVTAVVFTVLPFTFTFSGGRINFVLLRDASIIAAAWRFTAAVLWCLPLCSDAAWRSPRSTARIPASTDGGRGSCDLAKLGSCEVRPLRVADRQTGDGELRRRSVAASGFWLSIQSPVSCPSPCPSSTRPRRCRPRGSRETALYLPTARLTRNIASVRLPSASVSRRSRQPSHAFDVRQLKTN